MDYNDSSINFKASSFKLDLESIINYDANNKIIYISKEYDSIDFYSMDTKKKYALNNFPRKLLIFNHIQNILMYS